MTYKEAKDLFRLKFAGTCCISFEGLELGVCESPFTTCDKCRIAKAEDKILEALDFMIDRESEE